MHSIITSYLLQAGKCALPGIGFFKLKFKSAEIDIVNKQMLPPVEEVVFSEQALFLSPGFVIYLAVKKNIPAYEAEGLVNTFCREWKERLESGESLYLESIGCLQKNTAGIISFTKQKCPEYFTPVPAEKVFHVNTEHAVLVGDKQTTSTVMNEYYREESPVAKRRWVVGAIILGAIAIVILSYNFYNHKFSRSSIGNRSHFVVKPAGETYFKP